ncbi:hypothetical protein GQ602_002140 [Ophiocordyceps camponoti-floridani]|uniref:Uncharacterized protein n=1 Tax=Ophiocordyceps camponoti-floridani TaxID=2030778 RepID=A0A8H4Q9V2_9HYPO|nr:hypothetical protein GQ602_002140 [Ophiocordyceps camponoti-floridani]
MAPQILPDPVPPVAVSTPDPAPESLRQIPTSYPAPLGYDPGRTAPRQPTRSEKDDKAEASQPPARPFSPPLPDRSLYELPPPDVPNEHPDSRRMAAFAKGWDKGNRFGGERFELFDDTINAFM